MLKRVPSASQAMHTTSFESLCVDCAEHMREMHHAHRTLCASEYGYGSAYNTRNDSRLAMLGVCR